MSFLSRSRWFSQRSISSLVGRQCQNYYSTGRGAAKLDKRLIRVSGPDSDKFLNGLITKRVDDGGYGWYCGFLNSKGRLVSDSYVYPTSFSNIFEKEDGSSGPASSYLIECDPETAPTLLKSLNMYKLRADVEITAIEPERFNVWQVWDESTVVDSIPLDIENPDAVQPYAPDLVGATDHRAPGLGLRLVLDSNKTPASILSPAFQTIPEVSSSEWTVRRMCWGVPEGAKDLVSGQALPIEACMDYMGGIDFDKGCYVGQELTIRTHHHGIVRKRVVPVRLSMDQSEVTPDLVYDPSDPICQKMDTSLLAGASIFNASGLLANTSPVEHATQTPSPFGDVGVKAGKKRPSGTLVSAVGNIGLAIIRLEHFANADGGFTIDTPQGPVYVQAYIPFWWPEQSEGDLQQCPR